MVENIAPRKAEKLSAVKGMNDILPPESARWESLESTVRELMVRYAYRNIRTPILEHTALFVRGIGEVTDIVEKEMYSFEDRSDKHGQAEHLSMRPEGTAAVVRAVIESNLLYDGGKRLFYMGPMFRREKPQRGRYRQFHQVGVEALGFAGPDTDAEVILLASALWKAIGLTDVRLELNSLGQPAERALHRAQLIAYFERHADLLDEDAKRRLHSNPLRILDTKNPTMQSIVAGAPRLLDFLGAESLAHFEGLKAILDANDIAYSINPRLVRGLDYYNLTVFEFVTDRLGSQGTVCAGGRYDDLIVQIGGKPTPAVGWALGVERVLELLKESGAALPVAPLDAYAIVGDSKDFPRIMAALQPLRSAGVSVQMHASGPEGMSSLKSQFKKADASGARYALVFGSDELARGQVSIKNLRDASQAQQGLELEALGQWAKDLQSAT
ncbi:histidine--tRNA ligase [uncultured Rhodoferax sp.]|uniref:histidine--tRNA ligase n=1 Tax=uncultured Rhodoferax sp. TaxID=223188 RepID=UPI0025E27365|nr:histidine--tRNA ligase [uncultured Rhodoferax sp.]